MSKVKPSLKKEIFKNSMIFSAVILLVFSLFISNLLYKSGMSKAYETLRQRNLAVNYFIDGYFSEIKNTIEILATNKEVQNAPWLDKAGQRKVLEWYKSYADINKNITYIYSGYINKELVINNYIPPRGYDPTVRPWYQSAMAIKPKTSTGLPYQEAKSKEWLFSTSKALFSKEKDCYTGVISCDSSIEIVTDILRRQQGIYKSSYSFVVKPNGEIILHHDPSYLKKNLSEINGRQLNGDKPEGHFVCRLNGKKEIAFYSRCQETDWLVVTVVEKSEIVKPIIWQIFFCILLTAFFAVIFGIAQSTMLSHRFSTPLYQLRERVKNIIQGKKTNDDEYQYPENEIGIIAREVGQLTEHELFLKSKELEQKNDELKKLSTTDSLTGLHNRYKIDVELEKECQRSARYEENFSVIMLDIDWFKTINDTYGHQAGDAVLKDIALLLEENVRVVDIPGRWGGEEFLILCPGNGINEVRTLGMRLCVLVASHHFAIEGKVTISVGVAEYIENESPKELLKRVDDNLYAAKRQGRNTIVG